MLRFSLFIYLFKLRYASLFFIFYYFYILPVVVIYGRENNEMGRDCGLLL
ncbi:unnamed protein product [Spirodela intermedia]|uniref:Uncharacterized protein n=1 Tax=Spirodela intermedia TaxID=51605 RepID=A0A7I8JTE7_SPIIN|nr:unnamed protein product [Spirodela intermedia]CAA6672893.1 unnamed protein product [Spirodela intermedia]